MNRQEFNQVGNGFPMTTNVLNELQKAFSVFNGLGGLAGDRTILSGCNVVAGIVQPGVVYINGEVFEFSGGAPQLTVMIREDVVQSTFGDGVARDVLKTRYVQFGAGVGAMDWADFKRPLETKTLEASLQAVNDSLATIVTKLATIDSNAKVQVPTDWNATTGVARLLNKPQTISYLYKGTISVPDVTTDDLLTVTFPNVGTNNYMVVGSMVSVGSDYDIDNDVVWMIREKGNTSFKITLREVSNHIQDLSFEYMLVPL